MDDLFDAAAMYDEDYLYFFAEPGGLGEFAVHGPVVPGVDLPGEAAAELTWRLLDLRAGLRVLDLACGDGRLANGLAARGCRVTGLDSSAVFLDRARADAAAAGVSVDYVTGDMRRLPPWEGRFDRVINWSTAFGYFDDTANRAVLDEIARVLRPGGRLAMDLDNLTAFLASYCPSRVVAARENGDMLVALTGRFEAERTVIRDGRTRRMNFVKRLFGFPELRDWLLAAGFTSVAGYGEDARPLTAGHRRMIIIADLPSGLPA
jgi:SAM-dependent methyltransferase